MDAPLMGARHERAFAVAQAAGADALLAAHPGTVTWLTGYVPNVDGRPSPFGLGPIALVAPDEKPILVLSDQEPDPGVELGCDVARYTAVVDGELKPAEQAMAVLEPVLGGRTVATEGDDLPATLGRAIAWVDVGSELASARAVKDPDEIARLRRSISICDAGQLAVREHARTGMSELELWTVVRATMEQEAGKCLPILASVASGPRSGQVGGPPTSRVMRAGELLLVDIIPCVDGYWGDSCATIAIDETPSNEARRLWRGPRDALDRLVDAVRPGVPAATLDALVRDRLGYPHHTGHGIGTLMHESPRIAPGSQVVLEPGMVIALEPGMYAVEGVRLEWVVVVTEDGCEVLSKHDVELAAGG